jgi:hypothetical protein
MMWKRLADGSTNETFILTDSQRAVLADFRVVCDTFTDPMEEYEEFRDDLRGHISFMIRTINEMEEQAVSNIKEFLVSTLIIQVYIQQSYIICYIHVPCVNKYFFYFRSIIHIVSLLV